MASDSFGFLVDQNTLMAVILGAVLATIGGFCATMLERHLDKRERNRNAALFFGEILSSLAIILRFADETKKIGDPYGPITIRMLRSARSELDIYDRNRESIFDLHDAELRARIQTLLIRLSMPIDGVIEATDEIKQMRELLRAERDPAERADLEARIAQSEARREGGYNFIIDTAGSLKEVIAGLEPLAGQSFERLERIADS
ncbi:MAG TPA: hypothetical protein VG889_21910 [Rhizomicrobium sp.]|nr:hypothetical protein [Rhizomicrobium sp.]